MGACYFPTGAPLAPACRQALPSLRPGGPWVRRRVSAALRRAAVATAPAFCTLQPSFARPKARRATGSGAMGTPYCFPPFLGRVGLDQGRDAHVAIIAEVETFVKPAPGATGLRVGDRASGRGLRPVVAVSPAGAAECSRGWSAARRRAGGAQPVGQVRLGKGDILLFPCGASLVMVQCGRWHRRAGRLPGRQTAGTGEK